MWDSSAGAPVGAGSAGRADIDAFTVTNRDSSAAGPGLGAHTAPLATAVGGGRLSFHPDFAALGSGRPVFPLYLDPTWTEPSASGKALHYNEVQSGCDTTTNYNSVSDLGVGYNEFDTCVGIYRSFLDVDLSNLSKSDVVSSSTLKMTSDYSADDSCGEGSQTVDLYWSGPIGSGTDWSNQPGHDSNSTVPALLNSQSVKTDGNTDGTTCSGGVAVNFSITNAVKWYVDTDGVSSVTVALTGDESVSTSLERFDVSSVSLDTTYNVRPDEPANLTPEPVPVNHAGAAMACSATANVGWLGISNLDGKTVASLTAKLDSSVSSAEMYGVFTLDDQTTGVTSTLDSKSGGVYVTNGGTATVQTPTLGNGDSYEWSAVSDDQYTTSSSSGGPCYFSVDETPPANPAITSTDFPALSTSATSTVTTGETGQLTLTSSDAISGVRGFYYSFDSPVSTGSTYVATAGPLQVPFTTTAWGVHTLYALAIDNAGNVSAQSAYSFYVPWSAATPVVDGSVTGDGYPDLVTTNSSGDLIDYLGGVSPGTAPLTLSTPSESPDGTSWANYLTAHYGSFTNQGVDDLWAFNTGTDALYLYRNGNEGTAGDNFDNTADVTAITKADVVTDEYEISNAGDSNPTNACFATSTAPDSCSSYDNTDWSEVTQVVAAGDLYAGDPVANIDSGHPGLLTVEDGSLWYYQGQTTAFYLGTAIQLGTSGWNGMTVLGPGTVDGATVLWARDDSTGVVYQYPITFDPEGYPVSLGTPTGGSGTALTVPAGRTAAGTALTVLPSANYPMVYAEDLHGDDEPDLVATTPTGVVVDWPGAAPSSAGLAAFGNPQALGDTVSTTASITLSPGQTIYPSGSTWSNGVCDVTFANGMITVTNLSTHRTATFGPGGQPTAFMVFQTDGNMVIYPSATGAPAADWSADTAGTGASLVAQTDGNFVVCNSSGTAVWASGTE